MCGLGVFSIWLKRSQYWWRVCVVLGGRRDGRPGSDTVDCGGGRMSS